MSHVEKRYNDLLHKISTVQENRNNKFKNPESILIILYKLVDIVEPQVWFMKAKTS